MISDTDSTIRQIEFELDSSALTACPPKASKREPYRLRQLFQLRPCLPLIPAFLKLCHGLLQGRHVVRRAIGRLTVRDRPAAGLVDSANNRCRGGNARASAAVTQQSP
jgi:hypothetical protein